MESLCKEIFKYELLDKIIERNLTVGIIGLGYVGLPLALSFCNQNIKVKGFDKNKAVIDLLKKGKSHIHHIKSNDIKNSLLSKLFLPTDDFSNVRDVDIIIICVPTPLSKDKKPDLSYVNSALESIKYYLKCGQLISLESTTYPGTTKEILKPYLEDMSFKIGEDILSCLRSQVRK